MGVGVTGSLRGVHGEESPQGAQRVTTSSRHRTRAPGVVIVRLASVALFAAAMGVAGLPGGVPAALAQEPEPSTSTTAPEPTTTAPPTTVPTTAPTTEAPTTVPTTEAPAPTAPPTTSGGGGGTVRPAVSSSVPTTEAPTTTATTESPTVVAPTPGAVTIPEASSSDADDEPTGPWLSPDTQLRIAVGGLLALALVMVVLTVAYWRHTRPRPLTPLVGLDGDEPGDAAATEAIPDPPADPTPTDTEAALVQRPSATGEEGPVAAPVVGFSAAPPSALPPPSVGRPSAPGPDPRPTRD